MLISAINAQYNVNIALWEHEDGSEDPVEVTVLEQSDTNFVGWYTCGPFVGTIHISDGVVIANVTEF